MKLSYGWVIIGAGALMTCVAIGAMFSLAVFLAPMSVETGWSRAGISSAMTLDFLTMGGCRLRCRATSCSRRDEMVPSAITSEIIPLMVSVPQNAIRPVDEPWFGRY
jgi:hypothetical protein